MRDTDPISTQNSRSTSGSPGRKQGIALFSRLTPANAFFISLMILPFVFSVCLCFGGVFISPPDFFSTDGKISGIVRLRFFRLVGSFIVGGGLAAAGTAYQAVLRNPLAEPFILGISGGASLGAAVAIALNLTMVSFVFVPLLSFAGALIVLTIVLCLARGSGAEYTNNVMLSGIIAGTLCSGVLMFIISVISSKHMNSITWWMLGNLQPGDSFLLTLAGFAVLAGVATFFIFGREINVLTLGEETAYYLGISSKKLVLLILGLASLLTASVVALSGIIGFVGLVIPHILRKLFGANHRKLFPLSLVYGGIFLMMCDTFARTVLSPQEIPVGVITSLVGGPFFIWLINKKREG